MTEKIKLADISEVKEVAPFADREKEAMKLMTDTLKNIAATLNIKVEFGLTGYPHRIEAGVFFIDLAASKNEENKTTE